MVYTYPMPVKVGEFIEKFDFLDKKFVGTIALRSESVLLPDGSKMALGIDGGLWVLVYQKEGGSPFKVFEYDHPAQKIIVDKKSGGLAEINLFKSLVKYFIKEAKVEDLVTLLPESRGE